MTLLDLLILLIVAGLCGALGQAITGFSRGGCLVSIALGFIGALIGMWLARTMGLPELFAVRIGTTNFPIVWSIIGSALFVEPAMHDLDRLGESPRRLATPDLSVAACGNLLDEEIAWHQLAARVEDLLHRR